MFYISKVASELVRELPETQKELIIGDKSLMMRTLSLIDDEHFSPQWELIFVFYVYQCTVLFKHIDRTM